MAEQLIFYLTGNDATPINATSNCTFRARVAVYLTAITSTSCTLKLTRYCQVTNDSFLGQTKTYKSSWGTSGTLLYGEGDYDVVSESVTVNFGSSITISGNCYYYGSLSVDPGYQLVKSEYSSTFTVYKNTFNANNGTLLNPGTNLYNGITTNTIPVFYCTAGSKTTAYYNLSGDIPTRTGYSFKGWYTATSGGTQIYNSAGASVGDGTYRNSSGAYIYNNSSTFYAQWKVKTYTISYNANGGTGTPTAQTKTYGTALTLTSNKPTRTGYTFLGWSTSSTATSATYAAGGTFSTNITSDTTLYAVWKINTYTISYNANGGTGAPDTQTKTYNTALTLSTTIPTRTDYKFLGWSTSSTSTSTSYSAGSTFPANINVNTTLYAVWQLNAYTIAYDANGGTGAPDAQSKIDGEDLTLSTTVPTRNGYSFVQWRNSSTSDYYYYQPGDTYDLDADDILYAEWTPWTHTVVFDTNGGEGEFGSFVKTTDEDVTITSFLPTKEGYTFVLWNTAADGSGTNYGPGSSYNYTQDGGTVTLYAIYASSSITFYSTGAITAITFTEDDSSTGMSMNNSGNVTVKELVEEYGSNVIIDNTGTLTAAIIIEKTSDTKVTDSNLIDEAIIGQAIIE